MSTTYTFIKNAAANVARGSSAAIVALVLPGFLTRLMQPNAYGAWCLVLQISAYVGYLDFGIQTAVGRFVAHTRETKDSAHCNRIVSTSFVALSLAGALGLIIIVIIAALLPHMFPRLPEDLVNEARIALVLVTSSLAVGLPASVFNGVFIGYERFEVPALIIGGSKILSAVLLVVLVHQGGGLSSMAAAMAAVNLLSYALQFLAYRKMAPMVHLGRRFISSVAAHELFGYCFSLSIWSFGMLLISGLDVLLVGYFQFETVASYSIAATLVAFLAGLQNAIFGVMIPATAIQHARGERSALGDTVIKTTRYGAFLLLATGLPLLFLSSFILRIWVGSEYAQRGAHILQILVIANMIRLSAAPYIMTLIGTGEQRLVTFTPLVEGFSNLAISVAAGLWFGAIGVAIGTLIGSIAGVAGNFFYNMPRTSAIDFRISEYLRDGILRPIVCALPLLLGITIHEWTGRHEPATEYIGLILGLILTALFVWNWGLVSSERKLLRSWSLAL